jgi:antitoxin ParD1/3/4
MTTVTMNISLTEDLKSFVDARIKARSYSSTSEYVRELVRKDENLAKEERLKWLIQEGLDSGPGRPWEEHKAHLLARVEAHRATTSKAA